MTNIIMNVIVLAVALAVCIPVLLRQRPGTWLAPVLIAAAALCLLTLVFDTIMIGVGLYEYDPEKILGVYLWGAPVEDFFYPLVAVLIVPAAWTLLECRSNRRRAAAKEDPTV